MVWLVRTCNGFPEIFLIGEILQMPLVIPSRYEPRALLHTRDVHGIPIFHVDSAAFSKPVLTNAESITHNGVWVVPADARAAGGLPDFGIRERRCVFGIHILYTEEFLAAVCAHFPSAAALPTHVLYHGTAAEAWEGICASGLEPTFGMLGTGVYMGTFWKATRFAALTQSYQPRKDGIILRAYVPLAYTHLTTCCFAPRMIALVRVARRQKRAATLPKLSEQPTRTTKLGGRFAQKCVALKCCPRGARVSLRCGF